MPRLSQIDANLLVALDVLLEERHVTRAAGRLGVSQSAMSQTLQRVRDALEDPVLVRSGGRMVATPRAESMAGPLRVALRGLEKLLAGDAVFDPATAERTFRLLCLDTYAISLVGPLLARLAEAGPGLALDVAHLERDHLWDQLRSGEAEAAIVGPWEIPGDITTRPLFEERMLGMVRAGHPILDGPLDPERYVRWPHVVTRITGRGGYPIDERLEALGVQRRVVGRTPYFLAAPSIVVESDLIVTLPRSAALVFAERWPVVLFEPPIGDPMTYTVALAWPNYVETDAGHRWLRRALVEVGQALTARGEAV